LAALAFFAAMFTFFTAALAFEAAAFAFFAAALAFEAAIFILLGMVLVLGGVAAGAVLFVVVVVDVLVVVLFALSVVAQPTPKAASDSKAEQASNRRIEFCLLFHTGVMNSHSVSRQKSLLLHCG
jgi:fatty acid desaturase